MQDNLPQSTRELLKGLNPAQKEAVLHIDGALLILSGAGSGKTKTLITRLAYLIKEIGVPPSSTLTLTFTNKAAREMRERALGLIGVDSLHGVPELCTFHRFGLLFLREYIHLLNRGNSFIIIDKEDKHKMLKAILDTKEIRDLAIKGAKEVDEVVYEPIDEGGKKIRLTPALLDAEISAMKNENISPMQAQSDASSPYEQRVARIYAIYEEGLLKSDRVDFDDLLLLPYLIMRANKDIAALDRYEYIMVDEFQDTNKLQCRLLYLLSAKHGNLCVVGDEDQSIYGFRGARIENILNFCSDNKGATMIKLEENYRSTPEILRVANSLISNNFERLGKELRPTRPSGIKVEVVQSDSEQDEASYVANRIKELHNGGKSYDDIAILFRLNSLSRALEKGLLSENIPYKIIGGTRFYERSEVKDVISYLRLLINPHDNFSFARVINRPRRAIGKISLDKMLYLSNKSALSIYALSKQGALRDVLGAKISDKVASFFDLIEELAETSLVEPVRFVDSFTSRVDLLSCYKVGDMVDREGNLSELFGSYKENFTLHPNMSIEEYLNDISLETPQDSIDDSKVSCMSVHTSKGLEYSVVFIIGLEEQIFPMRRDDTELEEERRLGYVAFTRAKDELYLLHAKTRFHHGDRTYMGASMFINEGLGKDASTKTRAKKGFVKNDAVFHKVFGAGVVKEVRQDKITVDFGGVVRSILASFLDRI